MARGGSAGTCGAAGERRRVGTIDVQAVEYAWEVGGVGPLALGGV